MGKKDSIHNKHRRLQCPYCDKRYWQEWTLENHKKLCKQKNGE